MSAALRLAESLRSRRVLVLGDAVLDVYLEGETQRISREAPVPVVSLADRRDLLGGAANTAANAAALGGDVRLLSIVGADHEADLLRRGLETHGVGGDDLLVDAGRHTAAKHRLVAASQILVRFDREERDPPAPETEARLLRRLEELGAWAEAVIVSDYGSGVVTPAVVRALARRQRQEGALLVVDAHDPLPYCGVGATALKANWDEALVLLDHARVPWAPDRAGRLRAGADRLLDVVGSRILAVTLDADGSLVLERGAGPAYVPGRDAGNGATVGAGDTYTAAFALALAAGASAAAAAGVAAAAAAVVLDHPRTAVCSARELALALGGEAKISADPRALAEALAPRRARGARLVLTNGCFDLLHAGHIAHLRQARALGDILVVGLNGDAGVRALKGPGRPVTGLSERAEILAALGSVDHVVPFEGSTAVELVRLLSPDVYVKGGDHRREDLREAAVMEELGGEVTILPYLGTSSTTETIERIRRGDDDDRTGATVGSARSGP